MHIFLLTTKKFDLRVLPTSAIQHLHQFRGNPVGMSQASILRETRYLLDQLPRNINGGDEVFIVMEVNVQTLSAYSMLLIALAQVGIRPQIWLVMEKNGVYMGLAWETAEAMDWYQTHFERQLEQTEISKLEKKEPGLKVTKE